MKHVTAVNNGTSTICCAGMFWPPKRSMTRTVPDNLIDQIAARLTIVSIEDA